MLRFHVGGSCFVDGSSGVQNENTQKDGSDDQPTKKKGPTSQQEEISQRKNGFTRRAPLFSRTLRSSTFSYPASGVFRRQKKLLDIDESDEIFKWKTSQVWEFVRNLGKAYEKYRAKFRTISGKELLEMNEDKLEKIGIPSLHRLKILIEMKKLTDNSLDDV